jgi:hypothetical protein
MHAFEPPDFSTLQSGTPNSDLFYNAILFWSLLLLRILHLLTHARQALYHWATSSDLVSISFLYLKYALTSNWEKESETWVWTFLLVRRTGWMAQEGLMVGHNCAVHYGLSVTDTLQSQGLFWKKQTPARESEDLYTNESICLGKPTKATKP